MGITYCNIYITGSLVSMGIDHMTPKQKHTLIMWAADLIGSMLGGMIVTMFFGIVLYYGIGLGCV